jgi:hypothetical protein
MLEMGFCPAWPGLFSELAIRLILGNPLGLSSRMQPTDPDLVRKVRAYA